MSQTNQDATGATPTKTKREVSIKYRDVRIAYEVDEKSITELAEMYDIDWSDMKKVLADYGIAIRRNGEARPEPAKSYTINLVDTDKVVSPAVSAKAVNAATPATA